MGFFFKKIALFILPFLVVALPIDIFISKNLGESGTFAKGEVSVWDEIYDGEIEAEIAIYGSSRAWVQIDPGVITGITGLSAYNFGIDGHNFWLQYLRHKEYLKHNKKPGLIIHSVDFTTVMKRVDLYKDQQFLPFMLFNDQIYNYTSSYKEFNLFEYYLPLVRYIGRSDAISEALKINLIEVIT